jgi:hypothetical protein
MIPEVSDVMQDEAFISDALKIIAGERNGLTRDDRDALRKGALVIEEVMKSFGQVYFRLQETEGQLIATRERLREANSALATSNVFPSLSARGAGVWIGFNG